MNHIRARIMAFSYWREGRINFLDVLFLMLPESWRPLRLTILGIQIWVLNQYHIELIKNNTVVVDAGANIGVFSLLVAKKRPDCIIYAFEPTPSIFKKLQRNTRKFPNIKLFNAALGEKNGTAHIVDLGGGGECNHIGDEGIPIEMKTIDSLGIDMNFLKMDTEGYEAEILKGAAMTIKKNKPVIAMSAYHKPDDKTELPALLNSIAPYDCVLHHDAEDDFICRPL